MTEIGELLDLALAANCTSCGKELSKPGVKCQGCGTYPERTREEAEAYLRSPGNVTLLKAEFADQEAAKAFAVAERKAVMGDRLRAVAQVEQVQAELQSRLQNASGIAAEVKKTVTKVKRAATLTDKPYAEAEKVLTDAQEALDKAVRTREGAEAETAARVRLDAAQTPFARYKGERDQAYNELGHAEDELIRAEAQLRQAEEARDGLAKLRDSIDTADIPVSAERAKLLAGPFSRFVTLVSQDGQARPGREDEHAVAMSLSYVMAGATGALSVVEDNPAVDGDAAALMKDTADASRVKGFWGA